MDSSDKALYPGDPGKELDPTMPAKDIMNAAIAFFNFKGLKLSKHLLERALHVKDDSTYVVPNNYKNFLYNTKAYRGLCDGKKYKSGTTVNAAFVNKFNRDEEDAYYSIRKFRAELTDSRINIHDRYDFKEDNNSGWFVQIGTNAAIYLHEKGQLTYYNLVIPLVRK